MIRIANPRVLTENGKPSTVKILSYDSKNLDNVLTDEKVNEYYRLFVSLFKDKDDVSVKYVQFEGSECIAQLIPCGRCIGCRLEYSRQWAVRCVLESLKYECNYFLTLTYDDFNLPKQPFHIGTDPKTGEVLYEGHPSSLVPEHLTKFMKDLREFYRSSLEVPPHLRKKYGVSDDDPKLHHEGLRFFACGEYGGESSRPHFHVILFNCPIFDLKLYKRNFQGYPLYNSSSIDKIWKKGYTVIAEVNFDTCAYVARYIMKKQTGDQSVMYDILGVKPEFTRMSRMPGIGRDFFDENSGIIYTYDNVTILCSDGKVIQPCPPKYFDKLYADIDPEGFDIIKAKRQIKMAAEERKCFHDTRLSKATRIHKEAQARDKVLIALKRVN